MKDFLGNELAIGDDVVFYNNGAGKLQKGEIIAIEEDEDAKTILFINPHNFWLYSNFAVKVVHK